MRLRQCALLRAQVSERRFAADKPIVAARYGFRTVYLAVYAPPSASARVGIDANTLGQVLPGPVKCRSSVLPPHLNSPIGYLWLQTRRLSVRRLKPLNGRSYSSGPRVTDPTPELNTATARIVENDNNDKKLQLLLPAAWALHTQEPASDLPDASIVDSTYCIDIDTVKNNSRARRVAQNNKVKIPTTMEDTSFKYVEDSMKSWVLIINHLEHSTPVPSSDWIPASINGGEWDLLELYHYILETFPSRVIPSRPVIRSGIGSMNVVGEVDCITQVRRQLDGIQAQYTLNTENSSETTIPALLANLGLASIPSYLRLPKTWTKSTLNKYVMDITQRRSPEMLHQGVHTRDQVEQTLDHILFDSPDLRPLISRVALYPALSFLIHHRKLPAARRFITRMDELSIAPTVEFFNLFLMQAAKAKDYDAFSAWLNTMDSRGITPNSGTWLALLLYGPTMPAHRHVADLMHRKGLLKHNSLADMHAAQVIRFSLAPFLDSGGTVDGYIEALDKLLGPAWLNSQAILAMLDCLGQRLQMLEAVEVAIKLMNMEKSASAKLSKGGLHKLLMHCAGQTNADLAVWLVVFANQTWQVDPEDHIIFKQLFNVAWRSRMYNLCRVVWRYAIAKGEVGFWMRSKVFESLSKWRDQDTTTTRGLWKTSFGAVVCRIQNQEDAHLTPAAILDAERKYCETNKPSEPFVDMIAKALARDKLWSAKGIKKTSSIEWKMQNAIDVPLVPTGHWRRVPI